MLSPARMVLAAACLMIAGTAARAQDVVDGTNLDVCHFIAAEQSVQYYSSLLPDDWRQRDNHFLTNYFIHYGWVDLDGDGIAEEIKRSQVSGTAGGDSYDIALSSAPKNSDNADLSARVESLPKDISDYLNDYRVTYGEAFLPFKGRFYSVDFTDENGAFVIDAYYNVRGGQPRTACVFKNRVEHDGWNSGSLPLAFKREEAIFGPSINLDALLKSPVKATDRLPKSAAASNYTVDMVGGPIRPACKLEEGECRDIWKVDFDNDGVPDRLLLLKGESGAGRGCVSSFFMLIAPDGTIAKGAKQDLLLRLQNVDPNDAYPVRPCDMEFRWHTIAGRTMLERRSAIQPPYYTSELVDDLWMVKGGQTARLVFYDFKVTPEIIYDAAPK